MLVWKIIGVTVWVCDDAPKGPVGFQSSGPWRRKVHLKTAGTYRYLGVYDPQMRPASLVSTPLRMMAPFLKVGLKKRKFTVNSLQHMTNTTHMHMHHGSTHNSTSRLFVLGFEFLCSEVGKVGKAVIVKRVPCGGAGGITRCKSRGSIFVLLLISFTNTKLNKLGGAWLRCKWSTGKDPHKILWINYQATWIWTMLSVYASTTYWMRAASSTAPWGCREESLPGTPAALLAVASLGVRWWPRSSVVFGEAGGVWCERKGGKAKHTRSRHSPERSSQVPESLSQMCLNVRRKCVHGSCY